MKQNYFTRGTVPIMSMRSLALAGLAVVMVCQTNSALMPRASVAIAAEPQFGGTCAMGLAEGKRIKTDCKINWTGTDGNLYCFGNEDSKTTFLKDPVGNLMKARETYASAQSGATGDDMGAFTAGDVQSYVEDFIKASSTKTEGLFPVVDSMKGQTLKLKFDGVEFVRTLHGYGFFPNVKFSAPEEPAKKYQIDFWVKPKAGKLEVIDVRIYKAPKREGDGWTMMTRLPKPWWWIPASEHPGESETKRSWEVMSALHQYIADQKVKAGGAFKLKDDKTGEEVDMDFVGIHQPVRRLKEDGRFFACTDFRKQGTNDQYYDVDFWLNEKDGKIAVGGVRLHKVPMLEDGNFIQMPRYSFDSKTFDVVP